MDAVSELSFHSSPAQIGQGGDKSRDTQSGDSGMNVKWLCCGVVPSSFDTDTWTPVPPRHRVPEP